VGVRPSGGEALSACAVHGEGAATLAVRELCCCVRTGAERWGRARRARALAVFPCVAVALKRGLLRGGDARHCGLSRDRAHRVVSMHVEVL
jgi:hypothetical protein